MWNTKPEFGNHTDINDWRGQCVDVIAEFDKEGKLCRLDPGAIKRGLVQPEFTKNIWLAVPAVLRRIAEEQDPAWAQKLKNKWSA